MLCRVAEQIFWMGRYVERSIAVSRLVDVILHLELDVGEEDDIDLWAPFVGTRPDSAAAARQYLTFDRDNPSALITCIHNARTAARGVRESISSEMWERINTLFLSVVDPRLAQEAEDNPYAFYKRIREGAQATQGLADSTLAHGEDWHFFNLGTYLERADNVARVLTLENQLLVGGAGAASGDSTVRWLAVLRSCGSAEAYARYYSLRVDPARVIEFLLLNPTFPQSIRFSLNASWRALLGIAGDEAVVEGANPAVRTLGLLRANVEHAAVDEVLELGLATFLSDLQRRVWEVAEHVTRIYLRDHAIHERQMPAARAAMMMAAQQQQ